MGASRTVAAVVVSAVVASACGGGDSHRNVPGTDSGLPDGASSATGGHVGAGGTPGAGGKSSAGGAGTGGSPILDAGAGGSGGAQLDATPDVSREGGDAAPVPLVCNRIVKLDGGDASIAAGPVCGTAFPNGIFVDRSTHRVTATVIPGLVDVVGGILYVEWSALDADGGYVYGNTTVPVVVSGDTVVADLAGHIHANTLDIGKMVLDLDDACGTHTLQWHFQSVSFGIPDSGPALNVYCE